jgi:hypothetical protein
MSEGTDTCFQKFSSFSAEDFQFFSFKNSLTIIAAFIAPIDVPAMISNSGLPFSSFFPIFSHNALNAPAS